MRLGVMAGMGADWRESLEKVRIAEGLGYELVVTGEAWSTSAIPWLAAIALNTSRIQIGTSILNCFSRSPAAIAQEFAGLEVLSGGRMVFGIGSSGEYVVEHFHGVPFQRPLRRLREYVEVFNLLIAGERLDYQGEIFRMGRGFRMEYPRPRGHVPVYIAAITPASIRQTGEIADGIFPIHWPRERFRELKGQLQSAAAVAGRGDQPLTIAAQTRVTILDGRDDGASWRAARQPLHHYINRMGRFYWQMLERNGYEAEVAASRAAWERRDLEGSLDAISDRMVRSIQVIGTAGEVREQLEERAELGADIQLINMPEGPATEAARTLELLIGA